MNEQYKNRSLDGVVRSQSEPSTLPGKPKPSPLEIADTNTNNMAREPKNVGLPGIDLSDIVPLPEKAYHPRARWWQRIQDLAKKHRNSTVVITVSLLLIGGMVGRFLIASNRVLVNNQGDGALALQENIDPTQLKGEGDGRVNILLIGVGGEGHQAGDLSDSIILVSLDPIAKEVALLSVPRDLYLEIPGYGYDRINASHAYGERDGYPGGGPELLKETLSQNLGVPIHYYARMDFAGFKEAINIVGGVEVDVKESLYDESYPDENLQGYAPFQIEAGRRYMDGETALKYARSRYTTSDFSRSERQQGLLVAFKEKALTLDTLANPLKLNSLISAAGNHVRTDMGISELLKLVEIAKEVENSKIINAALTNAEDSYLASTQVYGASVLVPKTGDFSEIKAYVRNLLIDGYIRQEAANVSVLNGSDRAGLATATAEMLRSYGYKITNVDNAPTQDYQQTVIYDYSNGSKPYTVRYLEQRFGVQAERRSKPENTTTDLTVIVGSNTNND